MKVPVLAVVLAAALLTMGSQVLRGQGAARPGVDLAAHAAHGMASAAIVPSRFALPTMATAKLLLEGAVHTSEFVDVPVDAGRLRAFVSYPDRPDKAPVVVVNADKQGMSDWARAIAYQASRDGFIAVVPDYLAGQGPDGGDIEAFSGPRAVADALSRVSREDMAVKGRALQEFARAIPAGNGVLAHLALGDAHIGVRVGSSAAREFTLNDQGWSNTLEFLSQATGDRFVPLPQMDHVEMELRAQQVGRGGAGGQREAPGLNAKPDDLPSNWVMADKVVGTTPRKNEWVEVPAGTSRVHTWVVYPAGTAKVGAVLVLHGASGVSDWVRSVADQLAQEGFIALVPDLSSGLGPNGGNYESFRYLDDRMRATQKLGRENTMARIKAVREYAAKMPQSNGKTGSLGFCGGGTNSFTLATDVPEHNASVVFYGAAPSNESLAKAVAPVIGFYGENDARVFATVEPTRAEMKRLGKSYEAHTYPRTTHSFLWMQDLGNNFQATADAWPRAVAFLRQHLATPAPATR